MIVPWPTLEETAGRLAQLDRERLREMVHRRLMRESGQELPPLGRDEDPADVFVDSYAWLTGNHQFGERLHGVCADLAGVWGESAARSIRRRPEPLGELHYLCARVGATGAIEGVGHVAEREDLQGILLPGGEDLQLRALRSLVGLLLYTSPDRQERYQELFVRALETPRHLSIALTALLAFMPKVGERYLERASSQVPPEALENVFRNVRVLLESRRGPERGLSRSP